MLHAKREKPKVLDFQGFRLLEMARPEELESPTCRLGVDPIGHREVTSDAKKCLEILGFSAFLIPSDTML